MPTRESLHLSADRFGFWSLSDDRHDEWHCFAEDRFGKLYQAPVFPHIIGADGVQHSKVVIRPAKTSVGGGLPGETEALAQLRHKHLVSVLGFTHCALATGEPVRWLMVQECCSSDVEKLLYATDSPADLPLMLQLALQAASGLRYLHACGFLHLSKCPVRKAFPTLSEVVALSQT